MKTSFFASMILVGTLAACARETPAKPEPSPIVLNTIEEEKALGLFELEVLQDFVVGKEHDLNTNALIVGGRPQIHGAGLREIPKSCLIIPLWDVHLRYPKQFSVDPETGLITIKKGTKLISHFLALLSDSPSLSWRFADSSSSYDLTLTSYKISAATVTTDRQLLEIWNKILGPYVKISRAQPQKDESLSRSAGAP